MKKRGNKVDVYNGLAEKTNGGLKKDDLILNKRGAIVSKKRSEQGIKQFKNIEGLSKKKQNLQDNIPKQAGDAHESNAQHESFAANIQSNADGGGGITLKADAVQEEKNQNQNQANKAADKIEVKEEKKAGRQRKKQTINDN